MKLVLMGALGAALLAGCAPFQHGHYKSDVQYVNTTGDPPGTPLVYDATGLGGSYEVASEHPTYSEPVYTAPVYSEPVYSEPVYSEPSYSVHAAPAVNVGYLEPATAVTTSYVESCGVATSCYPQPASQVVAVSAPYTLPETYATSYTHVSGAYVDWRAGYDHHDPAQHYYYDDCEVPYYTY